MPKMKTSTTRVVPIVKDLEEQFAANPTAASVFMYDDGGVFRAFAVEDINFGDGWVSGVIGRKRVATIPADTPWRLLQRDCVDLRTGKEVEIARLTGMYAEHQIKAALVEKLTAAEVEKQVVEKLAGETSKEATPIPDPGAHFKVKTHL